MGAWEHGRLFPSGSVLTAPPHGSHGQEISWWVSLREWLQSSSRAKEVQSIKCQIETRWLVGVTAVKQPSIGDLTIG